MFSILLKYKILKLIVVLYKNNPRQEKEYHKIEASLSGTEKNILKYLNSNIIEYSFEDQQQLIPY